MGWTIKDNPVVNKKLQEIGPFTSDHKVKVPQGQEIEERTEDSKFHLRLDKQEFVQGILEFSQKDTIKIKIHTPVYNKKNTHEVFSELFHSQLD